MDLLGKGKNKRFCRYSGDSCAITTSVSIFQCFYCFNIMSMGVLSVNISVQHVFTFSLGFERVLLMLEN